jgi:ParB/RepB/Spo0J family partition protein
MSARIETPDILGNIMAGTVNVAQETRGALMWLPVGRIYDNPFQSRSNYDDVESLAESIWALRQELPATMGMQQPPVARVVVFGVDGDAVPVDRSVYSDPAAVRRLALSEKHGVELHFGHRRLRAWRLLRERDNAGYAEFPVLLAFADDLGMWRHVVAENAQRKDISAIEEAQSLRTAINRFNLSQEEAGAPFGYARTTVANKLRLLGLPEQLQTELHAGRMSERHGRALLRLAPAPHLWKRWEGLTMLDKSVVELEKEIEELIARLEPLAPAKGTGYKYCYERYSGNEIRAEKYDPPVWPYDWAPSYPSVVRGACIGCAFRATFGGDAGARCAEVDGACYTAKNRQWVAEQRAAQAAAIKAAPTAPAQPSTGLGGATATSDKKGLSDVSRETPAAPGISRLSASIAADRPVERSSDVTWFSKKSNYGDAPAALLDKGLCDIQRCGCMVVAFNENAQDHHVRPDVEHAPNMCVGCTSSQRLANRRKELEVGDLQEHRKRVKAEQEMAASLVRQAFDGYSADELWHNRVIMLAVAEGTMQIEQRYKLKDADTGTLQWRIFEGCAAAKCLTWDGSSQKWSVDKVQDWLHLVAVAAGRVEPEIGMVATASTEPLPAPVEGAGSGNEWWRRWEDDWNDDDEAAYQDLIMDWDGRAWQSLAAKATKATYGEPLSITPAVLRRLAQECPDVTLSGHFGQLERQRMEAA